MNWCALFIFYFTKYNNACFVIWILTAFQYSNYYKFHRFVNKWVDFSLMYTLDINFFGLGDVYCCWFIRFLLVLHFLTHHDSHENCNKKVEGRRRKLRSMHWLICHVLQGNNVFTKNKHLALDKIFWRIQLIQSGIQVIRNSVSFITHNWSNIFWDNVSTQ